MRPRTPARVLSRLPKIVSHPASTDTRPHELAVDLTPPAPRRGGPAPDGPPPAPSAWAAWRTLGVVALTTVLVLLAIDAGLRRISAPVVRREVQEGVADFARQNPEVLVLGSSHARTFHVLGQHLAERTKGTQTVVAVPLEFGKLTGYEWVLEHRLRPLLEERDGQGALVHDHLRRFVLLTEWWDSCRMPDGSEPTNLPSRAWHLGDFLADAWANGITDFNRNYLRSRLDRAVRPSVLVHDRGYGNIMHDAHERLRPTPAAETAAAYDRQIAHWQQMVEQGTSCIGDPREMRALSSIIDYVRGRGLEMTIVLFPRKPGTLTERAKATTLAQFAGMVRSAAEPRGVRVVDLTSSTPLRDTDFMADFDHVSLEGNHAFADWALANDLRFLLTPAAAGASR